MKGMMEKERGSLVAADGTGSVFPNFGTTLLCDAARLTARPYAATVSELNVPFHSWSYGSREQNQAKQKKIKIKGIIEARTPDQ
jgi:hypothetical protein